MLLVGRCLCGVGGCLETLGVDRVAFLLILFGLFRDGGAGSEGVLVPGRCKVGIPRTTYL